MIVKMKKIHLVVQTRDIPDALGSLRDLEAVHIEHQDELTGFQITERREEVRILTQVVDILEKTGAAAPQERAGDWTEIANAILKDVAEIESLREGMSRRQGVIAQWEPWGNFDPADIRALADKGVVIALCEVKADDLAAVPGGVIVRNIFTAGGMARCVLVAREKNDIPFPALELPPAGLNQLRAGQAEDGAAAARLRESVKTRVKYLDSLKASRVHCRNVLAIEEAQKGMNEQGPLAVLKGYCPADRREALEKKAAAERWALLVEDVGPEDQVPTCIRNPRWVEMIRPVFQLIDIMPGYREMDVSLVFLVFFSIFFGMLIGDAAYGAIFLTINLAAHLKLGRRCKDQTFFYLMYVLSGCTIIWGLLTGVVFGQAWLADSPVRPLVPWLADMNNMIFLCFSVAAAHLSIAHLWRITLKFPDLTFLAEAGWLFLVWTMFFVANMFVLNREFPPFGLGLLYVGMALVVMFTAPNKNPLRVVGPGLGALAMNFINSFTDVVSYIRLFAVGLATVAVADAFNEMALGIGFGGAVSGFFAALVLVLGHALNMILAGLAVLVHGVRLNVLEFSGHLGLEWGGFKYNPFRKIKQG
jgi:V/A-type H+-transporting ATPase subunit I